MNPISNETAGLQMPVPEQSPDIVTGGEAGPSEPASAEQAPAGVEQAPSAERAASPPPPMPLPLPPAPAQAQAADSDDDTSMARSLAATIIDDGDLIEKEWVTKAKQIVTNNRNDPYRQSEELTIFRANYMKKHYGKDIKLSK